MADPTDLSIAEAREALKRKELSAEELARAHIGAIERANEALNAYILTTPERALEAAKESDARLRKGEARPLEGIPLGIKDLFATKGVRTTACSHVLDGFTPTYELTVTANLWSRRRGHARQAQQRRVRHGLVQRDEPLRAGGQSLAPYGIERQARAWRIVGRLVRRRRGAALHGRHRHRHRRLDPPAGRGHRHGRHQADLWPLLALGHRRLRLVARSGGADRAHRAGRGDPAESHGEPRPEGHDERRCAGAGLRGRGQSRA